ncbi:MAG: plastocyanin domain-containing protein [Polyangiales bacterium]|jgi:plastocyanin domain-containing protein
MRFSTPLFLLILSTAAWTGCDTPAEPSETAEAPVRRVEVEVGAMGYTPPSVEAVAGEPLALVFRRTTDEGCGEELVFPDRDIRRDLPLNEDVVVELTPETGETIRFTCGMDMYRGSIVAQ